MKQKRKQQVKFRDMTEEQRKAWWRNHMSGALPALFFAGISLAFLFLLLYHMFKAETQTLNTDASLVVAVGDTVNISFTSTMDGEAFQKTGEAGEDLLIGSDTYIDDFEEQLVGHHVGETLEIAVTFPEDYPDDSLREKEAVYLTTITGIYQSE